MPDASPHPEARFRPNGPSESMVQHHVIFAGDGIAIGRWRCQVPFARPTAEHYRPTHALAFVHSGSYLLRGPRGSHVIGGGTVGVYNAFEPSTAAHPDGCGDHGSTLVLEPAIVRDLLRRDRPDLAERHRPVLPLGAIHMRTSDVLRHRLLLAAIEQREDPLAIEEAAHRLLATLAGRLAAAGGSSRDAREEVSGAHPSVERATRFLLAHFRQPLSLADLAHATYASPYHLCRIFRAATGTTLHRRLTALRLEASLDLLAHPGADLARTAKEVGFSTHSHFTAAFRQHLGCTPSAVRRALRSRMGRHALLAKLTDTADRRERGRPKATALR